MRVLLMFVFVLVSGDAFREKRSLLLLLKGLSLSSQAEALTKPPIKVIPPQPQKVSQSESSSVTSLHQQEKAPEQRKVAINIGSDYIKSVVLKITASNVKVLKNNNGYDIEIGNEVPKANVKVELPDTKYVGPNLFSHKVTLPESTENELNIKLLAESFQKSNDEFFKTDTSTIIKPSEQEKKKQGFQSTPDIFLQEQYALQKQQMDLPSSISLQQALFFYPPLLYNQDLETTLQNTQSLPYPLESTTLIPLTLIQKRQVRNQRILQSLWKKHN